MAARARQCGDADVGDEAANASVRARVGARESFKETAAVPSRALGAIGNRFDNLLISSVEAGSGFKIDGLLKIV